jgi:hypothetical protein
MHCIGIYAIKLAFNVLHITFGTQVCCYKNVNDMKIQTIYCF